MAGTDRAEDAVELARQWMEAALAEPKHPAAERLDTVLHGGSGRPFALGAIDGVLRPEGRGAAAAGMRRISGIVPDALPWPMRTALRLGGVAAQTLPSALVPLARHQLRELFGHLFLDARDDRIAVGLAELHANGEHANIQLLGAAAQGDETARAHLDAVHELIRRADTERVTLTVREVVGRVSLWAFEETVAEAAERLTPLFATAQENGTMLFLDVSRFSDLDLTIAVFTRILENPQFRTLEAGIALPLAYPDALPAYRELLAWAQHRVEHEGTPIAILLAKTVDLAAEQAESTLSGWALAPAPARLDRDAAELCLLDEALRPENTRAVRIVLADHTLFAIAYAWLLAGERGVREDLAFQLRMGVAPTQRTQIAKATGRVWIGAPAVSSFEGAVGHFVRLISAMSSSDSYLSSAERIGWDSSLFSAERESFLRAARRAEDPELVFAPRRTQNRLAPAHESMRPLIPQGAEDEAGLTQAVLGIGHEDDDELVATAVYARREERVEALDALGFQNAPDTDPALAVNREWAKGIRGRIVESTAGEQTLRAARVADVAAAERAIDRVRDAASVWGARPAAERAEVLLRVAAAVESRRGALLEVRASEAGVLLPQADTEVSAAVDAAAYYATKARELDAVAGATFEPVLLVVVSAPDLADLADGALAALAAGAGVILLAAAGAGRTAAVLAETLWEAGISRDLLVLADPATEEERTVLRSDESVDLVLGADAPQGKNSVIVMPSADLELAVQSIVAGAFSGPARATAPLVILVGGVGRSARLSAHLADAVRSLRVGGPEQARAEVGPLRSAPADPRAVTALEGDERWVVEPALLGERLWHPGIRAGIQPSSAFLEDPSEVPVLGVMNAATLERAIELQNAVGSGAAAALHTQNPADLELWLEQARAENLFVNRRVAAGIVRRQPHSAGEGTLAKAGGPNRLIGFGAWRSVSGGPQSSTLHLRGLDSRITMLIESAQPSLDYEGFEWLRRSALSDAVAWDREFGQVRDAARLGVERNLLRYRPVPVAIRATADAAWQELLRVVVAAIRADSAFVLSTPVGLPQAVRHTLSELGAFVAVESDEEWMTRMAADEDAAAGVDPDAFPRAVRARLVGSREAVGALRESVRTVREGALAVWDGEVTSAGRIELLPFVREQAISLTAHRFGHPDEAFAEVI